MGKKDDIYEVIITETRERAVGIYAKSRKEAIKKAQKKYEKGKYKLGKGYILRTDFDAGY